MMNVEGFEVDIFVETYDHLVSGKKARRAFMSKNNRLIGWEIFGWRNFSTKPMN